MRCTYSLLKRIWNSIPPRNLRISFSSIAGKVGWFSDRKSADDLRIVRTLTARYKHRRKLPAVGVAVRCFSGRGNACDPFPFSCFFLDPRQRALGLCENADEHSTMEFCVLFGIFFFGGGKPLFFCCYSPWVRFLQARWDTYPPAGWKPAHRGDNAFPSQITMQQCKGHPMASSHNAVSSLAAACDLVACCIHSEKLTAFLHRLGFGLYTHSVG